MTSITVAGKGVERGAAERASVVVRTRSRGDAPEPAMRAVSEAHGRVCDDARAFVASGEAERWHADRVWVSHHEEWVGDDKRRRLVFEAAASVHVTFVDVEALGRWIGSIGTDPVHEVGGIEWSLSDETRERLESSARAMAVADARRRASDLATAAGLGQPRIVEIREAGTLPPARQEAQPMFARAAAAPAPSIDLEAGEIEVASSITVHLEA